MRLPTSLVDCSNQDILDVLRPHQRQPGAPSYFTHAFSVLALGGCGSDECGSDGGSGSDKEAGVSGTGPSTRYTPHAAGTMVSAGGPGWEGSRQRQRGRATFPRLPATATATATASPKQTHPVSPTGRAPTQQTPPPSATHESVSALSTSWPQKEYESAKIQIALHINSNAFLAAKTSLDFDSLKALRAEKKALTAQLLSKAGIASSWSYEEFSIKCNDVCNLLQRKCAELLDDEENEVSIEVAEKCHLALQDLTACMREAVAGDPLVPSNTIIPPPPPPRNPG
jgi:hypothetical protein